MAASAAVMVSSLVACFRSNTGASPRGLMPMARAMSADFLPLASRSFRRFTLAASEAEDGVYLPSKRRDALDAGWEAAYE